MDVDEEAAATSVKAYYHLLRDNRAFTVLWIGEVELALACIHVVKSESWMAAKGAHHSLNLCRSSTT